MVMKSDDDAQMEYLREWREKKNIKMDKRMNAWQNVKARFRAIFGKVKR